MWTETFAVRSSFLVKSVLFRHIEDYRICACSTHPTACSECDSVQRCVCTRTASINLANSRRIPTPFSLTSSHHTDHTHSHIRLSTRTFPFRTDRGGVHDEFRAKDQGPTVARDFGARFSALQTVKRTRGSWEPLSSVTTSVVAVGRDSNETAEPAYNGTSSPTKRMFQRGSNSHHAHERARRNNMTLVEEQRSRPEPHRLGKNHEQMEKSPNSERHLSRRELPISQCTSSSPSRFVITRLAFAMC